MTSHHSDINCGASEILPCLKANKWGCHHSIDIGREHVIPGSETKDSIAHSTAGPRASRLHQCLLFPKSHKGDTKRPKWMLHAEWVWVTPEKPELRKPQSYKGLIASLPNIFPRGRKITLVRKQICLLSWTETLPLSFKVFAAQTSLKEESGTKTDRRCVETPGRIHIAQFQCTENCELL